MTPHIDKCAVTSAQQHEPSTPAHGVRSICERIARVLLRSLVVAIGAGVPAYASAAPCAGFNDVDSASAFCANVEWVKNRAVTLGCTAAQYCPNDAVTRLQMAAFMNRLGKALQPEFGHAAEAGVTSVGDHLDVFMCQIDYTAVDVARVATPASVSFTHTSVGQATVFAPLSVSFDGGTTWQYWSTISSYATNVAGGAASQAPSAAPLVVPAGATTRFALRPSSPPGPMVEEAQCVMLLRFDSTAS